MENSCDASGEWDWAHALSLPEECFSFLERDNCVSLLQKDAVESAPLVCTTSGLEAADGVKNSAGQPPGICASPVPGRNSGNTGSSSDFEISGRNADSRLSRHTSGDRTLGLQAGDPRLSCPNFLAGRIPCSCPELDERRDGGAEAAGVTRKRVKVVARCQVPSCRIDIGHLKGYHQRHRVCLGCANSSQVIVNRQPHRYCQQCGKFHLLSDFDEGKRSCRRKLVRHNNMRRRYNFGAGKGVAKTSSSLSSDREYHIMCSEKDGIGNSAEGFPCTKMSPSQLDSKFSYDNLKRDRHCIPSVSQQSHSFVSGGSFEEKFKTVATEEAQVIGASQITLAEIGQEYLGVGSKSIGIDKQSLLDLLMNDNVGDGQPSSPRLARQHQVLETEVLQSSLQSSAHKKHSLYMSPYPTGRVSFKLYDWNPADFPRRLRQQIFEWLSIMPVELEGYIRSGCTILTFFITMPHLTWKKMNNDWVVHAQNLFSGPQRQFWGGGSIIARLNNKSLHMQNGEVVNEDFKEELAPILYAVFPLCLEAGCTSEVLISGRNLFRTKSRFLVSFREMYLECHPCKWSYSSGKLEGMSLDRCDTCRITVCTPDAGKFGLAHVEVDHDLGVSNFISILVGDKEVCDEVNSLRPSLELETFCSDNDPQSLATNSWRSGFFNRQNLSDLLLDLGWVLRYLHEENLIMTVEMRDALLERFQRLLWVSITKRWQAVAKRLLQTAEVTGLFAHHGHPGVCDTLEIAGHHNHWDIVELLKNLQRVIASENGIYSESSRTDIAKLTESEVRHGGMFEGMKYEQDQVPC